MLNLCMCNLHHHLLPKNLYFIINKLVFRQIQIRSQLTRIIRKYIFISSSGIDQIVLSLILDKDSHLVHNNINNQFIKPNNQFISLSYNHNINNRSISLNNFNNNKLSNSNIIRNNKILIITNINNQDLMDGANDNIFIFLNFLMKNTKINFYLHNYVAKINLVQ